MRTEISSIISPDADIMQGLKSGFNKCQFRDGVLIPCDYHGNRGEAEIMGIDDNGGCKAMNISQRNAFKSPIVRSPQMDELLTTLGEGGNIAGGWWLVKEQREWLHRHMVSLMRNKSGDFRVLVAGVAGYAHFYSYLRILINAAAEADFDCSNLYVDVCDACLTPLMEIAAIENSIRTASSSLLALSLKSSYDVMGYRFSLSVRNRNFIKVMLPEIKKCHVSVLHCNIIDLPYEWGRFIGSYDVITEHFLLSMMQNVQALIDATRMVYAQMLGAGGHLLMACGMNSHEHLERLIDIHSRHHMTLFENDHLKVWDPFGISYNELQDMANNKGVNSYALLDNCMLDFIYNA